MRWRYAVGVVAVILVGAGGALAALWLSSGSSLDADERAVVEQVEGGWSVDAEEAAALVEDNIADLLSEDVAGEVDASDLASLFETALSGDAADTVFEAVWPRRASPGRTRRCWTRRPVSRSSMPAGG